MTMLLRKAWEMVLWRSDSSTSASSSSSSTTTTTRLSLEVAHFDIGDLEQLPSDILVQILKLLGPKGVAKLSVVCKSLRSVVSDNRLWIYFLQTHQAEPSGDSVFFAETTLSSGYPLPWVLLLISLLFMDEIFVPWWVLLVNLLVSDWNFVFFFLGWCWWLVLGWVLVNLVDCDWKIVVYGWCKFLLWWVLHGLIVVSGWWVWWIARW